MKQVFQDLSNGKTTLMEVPSPTLEKGQILIRTTKSLISTGTERMLIEFGKASYLEKARQQPEKVKMVLDKVKTDGLLQTIEAVRAKLGQPLALGYCNVGRVLAVAQHVQGFQVGERVVSNGKHAEVVAVPVNLCARIPDSVADDEAVFAVAGAIALQAIRLVNPTLGESVAVIGLGLIGLLTAQLLRAGGCRVLGIDPDSRKLEVAEKLGVEAVSPPSGDRAIRSAETFSRGRGVDAVIIAASTDSDEPIQQAAAMCRKRGRIVLVGVAGLHLSRDPFFRKELTFQVSCSYGPGRYDPTYEEQGHDYPVGYVRWTEQRNFEAVLDMMASERLDVKPLISHRFDISRADQAYKVIADSEPSLAILLEYPDAQDAPDSRTISTQVKRESTGSTNRGVRRAHVGFIGAGNYATRVLIPAFSSGGARLVSIASNSGASGTHAGLKYGFETSTTDVSTLLGDDSIDTIVVASRHDSHGAYVIAALQAGKNVFVEKPLCLNLADLNAIEKLTGRHMRQLPRLMVGFNRRFAPHSRTIKQLLASVSAPKAFVMTVNAGELPAEHWTQDRELGGGRIIGEACHFIDLLRFLSGDSIVSSATQAMASKARDCASITLSFSDGSIGTIHYLANGAKSFPKERLEVFSEGRILQLDNFRVLRGFGWPGFRRSRLWRQDKGQSACVTEFLESIREGRPSPIPVNEILEVSRISLLAGGES